MAGRAPRTHVLKAWPRWYQDVVDGDKHVELRRNDRDYQAGDKLLLQEWHAGVGYTGRSVAATVDYVVRSAKDAGDEGSPALAAGYVALAIGVLWETELDERSATRQQLAAVRA